MLLDLAHFFFKPPAPTELYTLSLHDALPISAAEQVVQVVGPVLQEHADLLALRLRSEEHTSELQSRPQLVCRLLLEKKKTLPPWLNVKGNPAESVRDFHAAAALRPAWSGVRS